VQLSMDDLEMVQVIGKGSGGVVQLVRHKWVGTLYALKVFPERETKLIWLDVQTHDADCMDEIREYMFHKPEHSYTACFSYFSAFLLIVFLDIDIHMFKGFCI
jgi:hypothetical protein